MALLGDSTGVARASGIDCSGKSASDAFTSLPYSETKPETQEDVRTKDLTEGVRAAALMRMRIASAAAFNETSVSVLIRFSKLVSAAA